MIVFVETNFLLELVLQQEELEHCQRIVRFAQSEKIDLVMPAYSLVEPYEAFHRRHAERRKLIAEVHQQTRQLRRSPNLSESLSDAASVERIILDSQAQERAALDAVRHELLRAATIISLGPEIVGNSIAIRSELEMSGQDSVVLASVLNYARSVGMPPSVFLNRNKKDFQDPTVLDLLGSVNCKLLTSFRAGCEYLEHTLVGEF
ncbi:MAG: hypothetical protein KC561_11360 [Myxococcales bacterium]|nr:hypothetical protein [Myxococcales bacterium]